MLLWSFIDLITIFCVTSIKVDDNLNKCKPLRRMESVGITPYILNIGTNGASE